MKMIFDCLLGLSGIHVTNVARISKLPLYQIILYTPRPIWPTKGPINGLKINCLFFFVVRPNKWVNNLLANITPLHNPFAWFNFFIFCYPSSS